MCLILFLFISHAFSLSYNERLEKNDKLLEGIEKVIDIKETNVSVYKKFSLTLYENKESVINKIVEADLNHGEYMLQHMANILEPGDVMIDIGLNLGFTSIIFAMLNPGVKIIGIEPSPENYHLAMKNIKKYHLEDRITVILAALSSDNKPLELAYSLENPGGSTTYYLKDGYYIWVRKYEVQSITFDELTYQYNLSTNNVRFIKMDCEGCEYDVIPKLSDNGKEIFLNAYSIGEVHYPCRDQNARKIIDQIMYSFVGAGVPSKHAPLPSKRLRQ